MEKHTEQTTGLMYMYEASVPKHLRFHLSFRLCLLQLPCTEVQHLTPAKIMMLLSSAARVCLLHLAFAQLLGLTHGQARCFAESLKHQR